MAAVTSSPIAPEAALERLRIGNRRFVTQMASAARNWNPGRPAGAGPFAAVLGCSDARVPVELVFDQGLGDLFVIRVAGNVVAPSLLGSVEFAVSKLGIRLVMVLGHTHCQAVKATIAGMLSGETEETASVRSITGRIRPGLDRLLQAGDLLRLQSAARLLEEAIRINVRASLERLRHGSQVFEEALISRRVALVGGVYDVDSGQVHLLDEPSSAWTHEHELFAD